MELIYLVGQISPKYKATYHWRQKLIEIFGDRKDIQFINPCDNPFNRQVLKDKEYAVSENHRADAIDVLPSKDYTFCRRSSMAVVNMNHYDVNKPMLGSFFELGWYYTMPEKTVIGFADDLNDYQVKHPFVQQAVTTWCYDVEEVADILNRYFTTVEGI